jgi:hypothetical protein
MFTLSKTCGRDTAELLILIANRYKARHFNLRK